MELIEFVILAKKSNFLAKRHCEAEPKQSQSNNQLSIIDYQLKGGN